MRRRWPLSATSALRPRCRVAPDSESRSRLTRSATKSPSRRSRRWLTPVRRRPCSITSASCKVATWRFSHHRRRDLLLQSRTRDGRNRSRSLLQSRIRLLARSRSAGVVSYWLREALRRNPADGDAHYGARRSPGYGRPLSAEAARARRNSHIACHRYEDWGQAAGERCFYPGGSSA